MQLAWHCEECRNTEKMIHNSSPSILLNFQQNVLVSGLQTKDLQYTEVIYGAPPQNE